MDFSNKFLKKFSKEKKEELITELSNLYEDYDFVRSIMCMLSNDADIDEILSFIRNNDDIDSSDVTLYAIEIYDRSAKV